MTKYDFIFDADDINESAAKIADMVSPGSVVLEFGSAEGRMTKHLKTVLGCVVHIVEIDMEAYESAIRFADGGFCGDIMSLGWLESFSGIEFDRMIFADVLEHLPDPGFILREAKKLLKAGGEILVSLPNIAHNDVLANLWRDSFHYTPTGLLDQTHVRFFALNDLSELAREAGLILQKLDFVYYATGQTEQATAFPADLDPELEKLLAERTYGFVYQFVFSLQDDTAPQASAPGANKVYGSVYYDYGKGYSVQSRESIKIMYDRTCGMYLAVIKPPQGVKAIRFDPVERPGAIRILSVLAGERSVRLVPGEHAEFNEGGRDCFSGEPFYYMNVEDAKGEAIEIRFAISALSRGDWERIVATRDAKLSREAQAKDEELHRLYTEAQAKDEELHRLYTEAQAKDEELRRLYEKMDKRRGVFGRMLNMETKSREKEGKK